MNNINEIELTYFSDGQPHIKTIKEQFYTVSIRNMEDLIKTAMVRSIHPNADIYIKYMLGARMDRSISESQPETLELFKKIINNKRGDGKFYVFFPHSKKCLEGNKFIEDKMLKGDFFYKFFNSYGDTGDKILVLPYKGSEFHINLSFIDKFADICYFRKERDPKTGKLSGFHISQLPFIKPIKGATAVIVDDLCDGGGTFSGVSKLLKKRGVEKVVLLVAHGVFSKGLPIDGIDHVYTSNSYCELKSDEYLTVIEL